MPSYNIELRNAERIWETLAVEADDVDALRVEVATFVGELMRDHARTIWQDQEWRVDVTDERGLIMFILHIFATDSAALNAPRR
jgi:tRNA threonylcarbamoyladenosine modification (KEOPS) complex  Pcc1 subunit